MRVGECIEMNRKVCGGARESMQEPSELLGAHIKPYSDCCILGIVTNQLQGGCSMGIRHSSNVLYENVAGCMSYYWTDQLPALSLIPFGSNLVTFTDSDEVHQVVKGVNISDSKSPQ